LNNQLEYIKLKSLAFLLIVLLFMGCSKTVESPQIAISDDLPEIRARGKLVAIVGYGASNYFVYRGQPMGYEYELLQRLTDHLGIELDIVIASDMDELFDMLNSGEGDIIAHSLAVTKKRSEMVAFTKPHLMTSMVLVQRKPESWRKMKIHQIEKQLIRNQVDLIGKEVFIRQGSSYWARMEHLSEEIGGDIKLIAAPGNNSTDDLIKLVAKGEINYTIADENIAIINQAYYANIDIKTNVSFPQRIAWAIRKNSPQLLDSVNAWIESVKDSVDYHVIYNKYFKNRTAFRERVRSDFYSVSGGGISQWDSTIQANAKRLGWDWRLLSSQIFQESRFEPSAKSWAGAVGLMQLMPRTAKQFGAINLNDPIESISIGVNYLSWLDEYWSKEITDTVERKKFVLGSYNVGYNHIADARRLAEKYDRNPDKWENNVAHFLIKKSKSEFFNDDVVKFGYCRGEEPVNYVTEIFERFEHYLKLVE